MCALVKSTILLFPVVLAHSFTFHAFAHALWHLAVPLAVPVPTELFANTCWARAPGLGLGGCNACPVGWHLGPPSGAPFVGYPYLIAIIRTLPTMIPKGVSIKPKVDLSSLDLIIESCWPL